MNIHCVQHVPFEGPGSIEAWIRQGGHGLVLTRPYAGEALPAADGVDFLIVMGGPMSIHDEAEFPWLVAEKRFIGEVIAAGKRVLGICLGAQLVASVLGARVYANADKEIGWFPLRLTDAAAKSRLFAGWPSSVEAFHWHGETFDIPPGAVHVAQSAACANQAFVYDGRVVGLQFHLEATPAGVNQLVTHCGAEIIAAPYIQDPASMLAGSRRFEDANRLMADLLTRLAAA